MNQEDNSKAVSFTNSYCALVDGLVSGFENCLAENVILDWFGKTIKSRSNVAAFMNTHKVNSSHVFSKINSTSCIGYNKKFNQRRARRRSINTRASISNGNISLELRSSFDVTPPVNTISSGDRSRSSRKIDAEGNTVEESDITLELNDDDLSKIFKKEKIQSTNMEEIEQKINQISLEERIKLISPRKREFIEVTESEDGKTKELSMNFIEAYGEILFSKKSRRLSGWGETRRVSSSVTHTWRKPCKLQIAYTSCQVNLHQTSSPSNKEKKSNSPNNNSSQSKVLSLENLNNSINSPESCKNDIVNNLKNSNYLEDDTFLKNLHDHLSKNEANKLGLVPKLIDDQLIFQKKDDNTCHVQNNFVFNHTIHVIIYEGRSRCRVNLSQKFA